jgi:hypothetical protein
MASDLDGSKSSVQEPVLREEQAEPHLLDFQENVYSQNGEDGILAEIIDRIGVTNEWFCEFGAWDGKHLSNTYRLLEKGNWRGVMIEADEDKYSELEELSSHYPNSLTTFNKFVSFREEKNRIDNILNQSDIPEKFGILSIDVDGPDYFIWRDMEVYRADIVVIELDSSIVPPTLKMSEIQYDGTSFQAMVNLARKKNYTPVCHTGNLILVSNEHIKDVDLPERELADPKELFIYNWTDQRKYLKEDFYNRPVRENIVSGIKILYNRGLYSGGKHILDVVMNTLR